MAEPRGPGLAAGRLLELGVADLALIERVRLTFAEGFNVLTGETGAGKSLLIDALSLALGYRADPGLVRHGAETARVEALFDRLPEPLVCVREVGSSGRSVARVDDETVTAGRLASIAGPLVEIHGQRDQGRLLDERWQRELLDAYGGHAAERTVVADAVAAWRANEAALAASAMDPAELGRRISLLEHEVEEIAGARLVPGEASAIRARLGASRHAEAIARGFAALAGLLSGDEPEPGAREQVARASLETAALARLDARFAPLADRLAGVAAELEDVASEARRLAETVDHDAAALAALEVRLSLLYSLERRYGVDVDGLGRRAGEAAAELDRLRNLGLERERRRVDAGRLLGQVASACASLSSRRAIAAADLGREVEAAVAELGLRGTRVAVAVGRRIAAPDEPAVELGGDAVAFDATGADVVVFQIAPNPGEPSRPLAKIASGGELSRLALAVEEVLASADATPTLVFDEIDSGIGGRSADPVGRTLWLLGRRHQVLCVTHLAQIAAHADAHFAIRKVERAGRTATEVHRLSDRERVGELAAMMGGPGGGATAEASAQALLDRAAAYRASQAGSGAADR